MTVLPSVPEPSSRRRRRRERDIAAEALFDGQMILRNGRPYDPAWDLWRPPRRWPGALLTAFAFVGLISAIVLHYSGHTHPKKPHGIFIGSGVSPVTAPQAPASDIQTFSGKAGTSTISFSSNGTLRVWDVSCKCRDNFGVIVRDSLGNVVDVPVNLTDKSASATPALYPAGNFNASVVATGDWQIRLIDPRHAPFLPSTYRFVSTGASVLGPFHGPASSITLTYVGSIGTVFSAEVVTGTSVPAQPDVIQHSFYYGTITKSNLPDMFFVAVSGHDLWSVALH